MADHLISLSTLETAKEAIILVQDLAKIIDDPYIYKRDWDGYECFFCTKVKEFGLTTVHPDSCIWKRARALVQ